MSDEKLELIYNKVEKRGNKESITHRKINYGFVDRLNHIISSIIKEDT